MKSTFVFFKPITKFVSATLMGCGLMLAIGSCNNAVQESVAPSSNIPLENNKTEPTSVIDLMEKEQGIKFFKKDVVLKDQNGSEITMRFASEKQEHLDIYLKMHDMTLHSSFKVLDTSTDTPLAPAPPANQTAIAPDLSNAIHVISERIDAKLAEGVKSYSLTTKSTKAMQNAKISASAPFYLEEISGVDPSGFKIKANWDMVWLAMDAREAWYNPNWVPIYFGYPNAWKQVYPSTGWFKLGLGGWRKGKAKIHYNWDTTFNYESMWSDI